MMQGVEEEDNSPELDEIMRRILEEGRKKLGPHPAPDELALYSEGMTATGRTEEIRAHAALCRECASALLEIERLFPADEFEASARESFERLRKRMDAENAPPQPSRPQSSRPQSSRPQSSRPQSSRPQSSRWMAMLGGVFSFQPAYALSALFLALGLALSYLGWTLYREQQKLRALLDGEEQTRIKKSEELAEKERQISVLTERSARTEAELKELRGRTAPYNRGQGAAGGYGRTNPVTVFPMDRRRLAQLRSGAPVSPTEPPSEEAPREDITLDPAIPHFPVTFPNSGPDFTLENKDYRYELIAVREPSDQSVYSVPDLKPDDKGYFSVLLPCRSFPPGEYRFKIFGHASRSDSFAKTILIAEYISTIRFKRQRP